MLGGVSVLIVVLVFLVLAPGSRGLVASTGTSEKPQRRLEIFGALCALAYVVENAWQNWSAVHLDTSLGAAPALASTAPAVFAAAAATGRISGNVGAASSVWSLPTALGSVAVLAVMVAFLGPVAGRAGTGQTA